MDDSFGFRLVLVLRLGLSVSEEGKPRGVMFRKANAGANPGNLMNVLDQKLHMSGMPSCNQLSTMPAIHAVSVCCQTLPD